MDIPVELLSLLIEDTAEKWANFAGAMLAQSSAVIAWVLLCEWALRRKISAIFRYALLLLILLKLVLPVSLPGWIGAEQFFDWQWWNPPTISHAQPDTPIATGQPRPAGVSPVMGMQPARTEMSPSGSKTPTETVVSANSPVESGFHFSLPDWRITLFILWLSGVAAFAILLCAHLGKMRILLNRTEPVEPEMLEIVERCKARIGLKRKIVCRYAEDLAGPAICGLLSPRLLLPRRITRDLLSSELEAILLHELIHIRRLDSWIGCIQAVLQGIYFFHPLLWLANRRIAVVREQAVDEQTAAVMGNDPAPYCRALVNVAALMQSPLPSFQLLGIFESERSLRTRVVRLLQNGTRFRRRLLWRDYTLLLLIGAVLLPLGECSRSERSAAEEEAAKMAEIARAQQGMMVGVSRLIISDTTDENVFNGKTYEEWIEILNDREEPSWEELSRAIQFFGPRNGEAIPGLMQRIREDYEARNGEAISGLMSRSISDGGPAANAAFLLAHLGKASIPAIRELLLDKKDDMRLHAIHAATFMNEDAKDIVPLLNEMMKDPSPEIRYHALSALEYIGPYLPDVVPGLLTAYRYGDWNARERAARAFGNMGPKARAVIPVLIEDLQAEKWKERELAAKTLARMTGRLGTDAAPLLQPLIKALGDTDWPVRFQAAIALGWMGVAAKEAIPALQHAEKDDYEQVRGAATVALQLIRQ